MPHGLGSGRPTHRNRPGRGGRVRVSSPGHDRPRAQSAAGSLESPYAGPQFPHGGDTIMKRSSERILTTHTGSLPRPSDLAVMLESLDSGTLPDPTAFETRVRRAVAEIVRMQV